jgi:Na+-translocating ferredoxin:NAD+ oxidoreductase RnfG subunit
MSRIPKVAKRDGNEKIIIAVLRQAGATVQQMSIKGAPDLLVGFKGRNYLMEVKQGNNPLTMDECTWHDGWRGQVAIIYSVDDALRLIGRL